MWASQTVKAETIEAAAQCRYGVPLAEDQVATLHAQLAYYGLRPTDPYAPQQAGLAAELPEWFADGDGQP